MNIYMVRHGESAGNVYAREAKERGLDRVETPVRNADLVLSPLGEKQAMLINFAEGPDPDLARVFTSPYVRAVQTAELAGYGHEVYTVDERLRERDLGILDGLTTQGIQNLAPQESEIRERIGKFYHRPAGGESWADVIFRVRSFLSEVYADDHTPVVVFAHDVVVLSALYICNGWSEQQMLDRQKNDPIQNASVTHMQYFR